MGSAPPAPAPPFLFLRPRGRKYPRTHSTESVRVDHASWSALAVRQGTGTRRFLEIVATQILDTPELRTPRRPTTLKQAARGLKSAHAGVGIHQTQALAHAIIAGWYLHYAKGQVSHGEFCPWLEKHFNGSRQRANVYRRIACSYVSDPGHFTGTESIEEAIKIARSLAKPEGLPEWLPDLLEPPETPEQAQKREQQEREREAKRQALEEDYRQRIAEAEQKADEKTVEEAFHPDSPAGRAARKVEGLIAKGKSTDSPEADAFWQKARDLIETHDLEIMASVRI